MGKCERQTQSFYGHWKALLRTQQCFENFYANSIELNLCVKDGQVSYSMFFVLQDLSGYTYLESPICYISYIYILSFSSTSKYPIRIKLSQVALNRSSNVLIFFIWLTILFLLELYEQKRSHIFLLKLILTKKPLKIFCTGSNFIIVEGISSINT